MSTPESRYDFTSILLHWLVAFFIFAQFIGNYSDPLAIGSLGTASPDR